MQQKSRRLAIIGIIIFILFGIIMVVTHRPSTTTQRQTHPNNISVSQFISQLAPQAQREQKRYHIPASVIIAQAGTESNWGRNKLAVKYNNLFGVKASKGQPRVKMVTTEYLNGKKVHLKQYFRVYNSWDESIRKHTLIIINGTADNPQRYYSNVRTKSYRRAVINLQKDGYATDPQYANKLIYAIRKFNLQKYDC